MTPRRNAHVTAHGASGVRAEVVDLLVEIAFELKERGDIPRARAYQRAAREVAARPDFDTLFAAARLRDIKGVGASIARTITNFVATGERPSWLPEEPRLLADVAARAVRGENGPFAGVPDLHCHTLWSDGAMSIDMLVATAKRFGARAVGVSDHSASLRIARGLDADAVRAQWAEIARVQAAHPDVLILRGTECDILRDGALDHPADLLAGFDYVIASLHSHLKLDAREQTERVSAALGHPAVTIWGHPTTRVPGHREPAALDLPRLFDEAATQGVAPEVNGNAGRLDLDADLARDALARGCRLALGSDAHHPRELVRIWDAAEIAHAAGAGPDDIINFETARGRTTGAPPGGRE